MTPRFHYPGNLAAGASIVLPREAAHHARRVLRLNAGDAVILFDGTGGEWQGRLVDAGGTLKVALARWQDVEREAPLELTLAQALPGAEKMDWLVQKAVELGVGRIQPLAAKRSVVRLTAERAATRLRRWQQVVISACEQCGRNRVPEVAPLADVPHYLASLREGGEGALRLILSPRAQTRLSQLVRPPGPVVLLVGPEGGFDPDEEKAARLAGFQPVALGPRVLRAETAGMAAMAAMMALWGDF